MRLKKTGVPDVKIRLYYQNNKAETAGPQCLNLCLSAHPLYLWHCPNMGVPVFNWLCLSGLPQLIHCLHLGIWFYQSFFKKTISPLLNRKLVLSLQPRTLTVFPEDTSKLLTCFCHILGRQPKFIGLFKFTDTLQYCPIDWNTFNILISL